MQDILTIDEICERAKAIGLPLTRLAQLADVDQSTVHRIVRSQTALTSTLAALRDALLAQEQLVLNHLQALHPQQQEHAA